jgi:hypothetical protein
MSYKTKEQRLAWMKNYYQTHPDVYEKHKASMRLRKRVYAQYKKDKCEKCGQQALSKHNSQNELCVHHQNRDRRNNNLTNLITLCRKCHALEHLNDPENLLFGRRRENMKKTCEFCKSREGDYAEELGKHICPDCYGKMRE